MLEYKVVTANDTDALENRVTDLIDLGFRPVGGVAVMHDGRFWTWAHAMTRESAAEVPQLVPFAESGDPQAEAAVLANLERE